ncbi:hypothetical protein [Sulfobacillus thermosulfidooxidans]|uniref:hypothetical protein n=1 Tax=Sulfobacillus thermosulfidooxidans TaxID=28034 RepID=UPI0006B4B685|nr:hypothetical protein [Sulfobacillus thermosulfidooxidans]
MPTYQVFVTCRVGGYVEIEAASLDEAERRLLQETVPIPEIADPYLDDSLEIVWDTLDEV